MSIWTRTSKYALGGGGAAAFFPGVTGCGMATIVLDDAVTWVPSVDLFEVEDCYILNAELPGVELSDLKVECAGSDVTVSGERRMDDGCARHETYHRLEGHRGRFHRTFSLPTLIDPERMNLELKGGVLRILLPKSAR